MTTELTNDLSFEQAAQEIGQKMDTDPASVSSNVSFNVGVKKLCFG